MIRARYRDFIRPDPRRELEDELRFHLEAETEALIAEGLSPAAARQRALAKFGDVDKFLADCGKSDRRRLSRTQRTRVVDALRQDTAYAARALLRRPAFSVTAILVLALGVGANAAVMSVVDHIFLRPPAVVRAPDRLKRVFVERQREDNSTYFQVRFSLPEARIIDSTISSGGAFPSTIFFRRQMPFASTGSTKRSVMSAWVTPSYFSVLGVHLYAGTDFAPEDSRFGVPATSAIVSWALWQRELGGDPNVIGRVVTIDGSPMRIRGIAPRGFVGVDIDVTDVWLPLGGLTAFRTTGQAWYNEWGLIAFRVLARVPDGVDERQLVARVEGAMRIAAEISAREMSRKPPGVRRAIAAPILTSHGPEHASRSEAIAAALAAPMQPPAAREYPAELRIVAEGTEIAKTTVERPTDLLTAIATTFRESQVSREYRQLAKLLPAGSESWARSTQRRLGSILATPVMRSKERRWLASAHRPT